MNPRFSILACLLVLSGAALARDVDKFDAHCADILILQDKGLQKYLHISKAQVDQMNLYANHHTAELAELEKKVKGTKTDPNPELYKYFAEMKDAIVGVLTPPQLKRLRELSLWHVGLLGLCDPIVGKRVGLSDAQMKTLRDTYDTGFKKYNAIERAAQEKIYAPYKGRTAKTKQQADAWNKELQQKLAAAKKEITPQLDAIRTDSEKRMRAVMTSAQLSTYNALKGAPYKP